MDPFLTPVQVQNNVAQAQAPNHFITPVVGQAQANPQGLVQPPPLGANNNNNNNNFQLGHVHGPLNFGNGFGETPPGAQLGQQVAPSGEPTRLDFNEGGKRRKHKKQRKTKRRKRRSKRRSTRRRH
jgi:hypothetical protein